MAVEWKDPKTDWKSTDRFNISDFNRIKNNILWLREKAEKLYKKFDTEDMGEDITSYTGYWIVEYFNAFEKNVDKINSVIYTQELGTAQRFFENGAFIKWDELNRIEIACSKMKNILDRQEAGLSRLSIRLGGMKGVNV